LKENDDEESFIKL